MEDLSKKINQLFEGRVVRKDLTHQLKSGVNVPSFVLEYLLGMNAASDDEEIIKAGVEKVKMILSENLMRYDEVELVKSRIREKGGHTIIDKITAELDPHIDAYVARFQNFDVGPLLLSQEYIRRYEKILLGGLWIVCRVSYVSKEEREDDDRKLEDEFGLPLLPPVKRINRSYLKALDIAFSISNLNPIQMPVLDFNDIVENRQQFTSEEWRWLLLRSCGYEPSVLTHDEQMHLLLRLIPLVERNYNLVELGPRSTGKSYIYKEISPYSILMSGGKTTVANLFFNMSTKRVGLVGLWDAVAFDEVAGMEYKDDNLIQILKDYMASGSFARGKESITADGSIVYIGNIDDTPENILKTNHLFAPFPESFRNDSAFFDRIHAYLPGWEIPKFKSEHFTSGFGFLTDYLAEFMRSLRSVDKGSELYKYFEFSKDVNKRDEIAIKKTVSGFIKLFFPDDNYTKDELKEILRYAISVRRRVKEQLKRMIGSEFDAVNLGFIDRETQETEIIHTKEQPKTSFMDDVNRVGKVYLVGTNLNTGLIGAYAVESKMIDGDGSFQTERFHVRTIEMRNAAFTFFTSNFTKISTSISVDIKNFLMTFLDIASNGVTNDVSVGLLISLFSSALNKPVQERMIVAGNFTLTGQMEELKNLKEYFRVAINAKAAHLLLPTSAVSQLGDAQEYVTKVNIVFYNDPIDAVKKALGLG